MKKNKMMRVASALLIAVLLTTSAISGTFAKYVTQDSANDTARVAKWGVTALVSGTLFGENYVPYSAQASKNEISASAAQSVDVDANGGNIVAPGTKNSTGMTLSVKGTPEVANVVSVSTPSAVTFADIYLKAGSYATLVQASGVNADNYADYYVNDNDTYRKAASFDSNTTYYEAHDVTNVAENENGSGKYYPILWTLSDGTNSTTYRTVAAMDNAIGTAFNTAANTQNNPNTAIDKTYTITWAWAFENSYDGADTILGNIIAGASGQVVVKAGSTADTYVAVVATDDYNTSVAYGVTLTVTQVD